jgi:hypothetical protein
MGNLAVVRNIEVSTAVVEIKTLVVGAKQFTVAMLKQLPEKGGLLSPSFDGRVWGHVIYPLGRKAFHIIYANQGRLWRASFASKEDMIDSFRYGIAAYEYEKERPGITEEICARVAETEQLFIAV